MHPKEKIPGTRMRKAPPPPPYVVMPPVLSKVDDFATFKKVKVHAKNSTF